MVYNKRKLHYKGMPVNLFGLPSFSESKNKTKNKNQEKKIKRQYLCSFVSNFKKDEPKNLLLIYDIPEGKRRKEIGFVANLKILILS